MKLTGGKIYLRPISIDDTSEEYVNWLNDKDVNQYLESRFEVASMENLRSFIEITLLSKDNYFFAIVDNQTDKHIGNIKIGPVNRSHKRGDIGILIGDKKFWGKGIATEAISLVSEFALSNLNLNKVTAGCYSNNIASYKAFLNCGFVEEGFLNNHYISSTGEGVGSFLLAKFK
jgi:[ribosomal protein S5]-alanine N-acetyltransferase